MEEGGEEPVVEEEGERVGPAGEEDGWGEENDIEEADASEFGREEELEGGGGFGGVWVRGGIGGSGGEEG